MLQELTRQDRRTTRWRSARWSPAAPPCTPASSPPTRADDRHRSTPRRGDLLGQVVEINVNAHSLGIEVKNATSERINDILIPKNTQLPTRRQPRLPHRASRTSRRCASRCCKARRRRPTRASASASAGSRGCRRTCRKQSPVQVRCGVGSNGLIDVMALDMTSGKMARTEIHRTSGLTDEEIAREAEWVRSLQHPVNARHDHRQPPATPLASSPCSVRIRSAASTCWSRNTTATRSCRACCARRRSASAAATAERRQVPKKS